MLLIGAGMNAEFVLITGTLRKFLGDTRELLGGFAWNDRAPGLPLEQFTSNHQ